MNTNTTVGFLENLLVPPSSTDWESPKWICHLINQDPDLGQQFINKRLSEMYTYAEKMEFLIGIKVCIEYTLQDLENFLEDNKYPVSCCPSEAVCDAENSIRHFRSALLKINSAICNETDCNKIPCESQPKSKTPNLSPHQWTLAYHIFFKALNIDTSNGSQINQILLARFLHLVTGEDCPEKITNSKYLDYVKNAPEYKRTKGKQIVQDLESVRVHFERVRFSEALPIIDAMLAKYQRLK